MGSQSVTFRCRLLGVPDGKRFPTAAGRQVSSGHLGPCIQFRTGSVLDQNGGSLFPGVSQEPADGEPPHGSFEPPPPQSLPELPPPPWE